MSLLSISAPLRFKSLAYLLLFALSISVTCQPPTFTQYLGKFELASMSLMRQVQTFVTAMSANLSSVKFSYLSPYCLGRIKDLQAFASHNDPTVKFRAPITSRLFKVYIPSPKDEYLIFTLSRLANRDSVAMSLLPLYVGLRIKLVFQRCPWLAVALLSLTS